MNSDQFNTLLRSFRNRKPFQRFTVILVSGERIDVDQPEALAVNGGAGGFIRGSGEPVFFECEEVREITSTPQEALP
jgi:hypothetical protein